MPSPFHCTPVIRECSQKETQIEKKKKHRINVSQVDSLIGEKHVLLNMHFENLIVFDKEYFFLQEICKEDYALCVEAILRNRVRLNLVYSWLLECFFLF